MYGPNISHVFVSAASRRAACWLALILWPPLAFTVAANASDTPPWVAMDYGPFLSATIEAPIPEGNIANKGIMVNLAGARGKASVLFDVDLLHYAAGWIDGDLNWKNVVYDGEHGQHPHIVGTQIFGSVPRPGWSRDGSFADPRPLPYGPLPRGMGLYRGLYLHGDHVVFAYTVGMTSVLDSPRYEDLGEWKVLTRTLAVDANDSELALEVCTSPGAQEARVISQRRFVELPRNPSLADSRIAVFLRGDADGVSWDLDSPGAVRLRIPASRSKRLLAVSIASTTSAASAEVLADRLEKLLIDDPTDWTHGGPSRWPDVLITKGTVGQESDGPFVVDTVTWPAENPWRSWMRFGGFDFFTDATKAAVCTWSGDVWLVEGLDGDLDELHWRRFATGMFQPLGLRIVKDTIYVSCRDQIVRLHDLNDDGAADYYECFNADHQVTPHFHEFAMDLQTGPDGDFYYAKSARHALDSVVPQHGTLIHVSADGTTSEIVCNGFRAANGVGISPTGEMATSDQEGHWMPASRINLVRPGGFYGNMYSYHRGSRPTDYIPPVVWLPKTLDRSPAEQFWVPKDTWGALGGKLLSLSYGTGELFHVMYEQVDGVYQGAIVKLPGLAFPTGVMRGRFNPGDGQLYICGLVGWSSNRFEPGGFYRVRRTNRPLNLPVAFHALSDGVSLTFSDPLDRESAVNVDNYFVERWNYRWTENYGSDEYSVEDPEKTGHDEVWIDEAILSSDGRTVRLTWEDQRPVMQIQIGYALQTADGAPLKQDVYATINAVPKAE